MKRLTPEEAADIIAEQIIREQTMKKEIETLRAVKREALTEANNWKLQAEDETEVETLRAALANRHEYECNCEQPGVPGHCISADYAALAARGGDAP